MNTIYHCIHHLLKNKKVNTCYLEDGEIYNKNNFSVNKAGTGCLTKNTTNVAIFLLNKSLDS